MATLPLNMCHSKLLSQSMLIFFFKMEIIITVILINNDKNSISKSLNTVIPPSREAVLIVC